MPPPNYKVGDRVYLSARNLRTRRPSLKLDWKSLSPYKIIERVGPLAFRLELPPTMAIHDVFHVNLLRPAPDDPLTGQALPAPPPVFVDDLPEYAVEAIVDSMRDRRRGVLYKVQWVGYAETTWEPWEHVKHLWSWVSRFHQRYPHKPRHPASRRTQPPRSSASPERS